MPRPVFRGDWQRLSSSPRRCYLQPMATMNVSLEDDLKAFATGERVRARGFSSASEYVRHLVRVDRELDRLRGLIEEGLGSGAAEAFTDDDFEELRRRAREG